MGDHVGPVGELSAAEAKQHKTCTRSIFRERESMRIGAGNRVSKLALRTPFILGYLSTMFSGMERSDAKDYMPRLDILVHHPLFKDAMAFLCKLAGYQPVPGHQPYVLGTEIPVEKYGSILYVVTGEALALALMWRAACGGVMTSFQDISFMAGMLSLRKDVLLAGCSAKGIEGLIALESMVTQVMLGCGKGNLIKERLPLRSTVPEASVVKKDEERDAEQARWKRERDEATLRAETAEADLRRARASVNNNSNNNNGGSGNNNNNARNNNGRNNNNGGGNNGNRGNNNNDNNNNGGQQRNFVLQNPSELCTTCTGRGHLAATCVGRLPFMTMVCNVCKGIGHPQKHCPSLHH